MQGNLRELFEKYLDECRYAKRLRPETVRGYSEVFKTFCSVMPEIIDLGSISPEMVTVFFRRLETRQRTVGKGKKAGIKASTVKTYGGRLGSFFDWLTRNGHLAKNPLAGFAMPVPVYEDHRSLKRTEVEKIISAITAHSINAFAMRRDLAMVYVFLFCGLRRTEFLSLKGSDIDPYQKLLTVNAETSKSKKTRRLHIHPTLWLHLSQYLKERKEMGRKCEYLWLGNGGDERFTSHGLKHWVRRLVRLSGIKFHVHRFRHTFATNLGSSGASVLKIHKLMGHSQISMTMAYLRSMQAEDLHEDIDRLSIEGMI